MKTFIIISFLLFLLASCTTQNEEKLESLDKKSAREVTLTTLTKGDTVYHLTHQNIWVNGERIAQKTDTIITRLHESHGSTTEGENKLNEIPIYVTVQ